MTFDEAIAPHSRHSFLAEHWKRTLLCEPGDARRFAHLIDWDTLNRLLEQHDIPPPRLRLVRNGMTLDPSRYRSGKGKAERLDPAMFTACFAGGATLVLDRIEQIVPALGDLAENFEQVLGARVTVNLYAGMAGSQGFDLHWDSQDVMILQISGSKRWRAHAPTLANPLRDMADEPPQPRGDPDWSGDLGAGDMLYLPRGWWHGAAAIEMSSLHLTVTIVPPRGTDFLDWLSEQLRCDPDVRADVPLSGSPDPGADYFLRLSEKIVAASTAPDAPARFLGDWIAKQPPRSRLSLPLDTPGDMAAGTSKIRLTGIRKLRFEAASDGSIAFDAGGQHWRCSPDIAVALGRLSASDIRVSALFGPSLAPQEESKLRRLLVALKIAGVVQTRDDVTLPC